MPWNSLDSITASATNTNIINKIISEAVVRATTSQVAAVAAGNSINPNAIRTELIRINNITDITRTGEHAAGSVPGTPLTLTATAVSSGGSILPQHYNALEADINAMVATCECDTFAASTCCNAQCCNTRTHCGDWLCKTNYQCCWAQCSCNSVCSCDSVCSCEFN